MFEPILNALLFKGRITAMKKLLLMGLLLPFLAGCTGSGAVNPLSPTNATKQDASTTADSDVIYWTTLPLTFSLTDALNGVCLINKKLGWACGNNGVVLKYDGETWNKVQTGLAQNENLMAVAFLNETEGWIVGTHGSILHYNNGTWNLDDSQTSEILYSVAVTRSRTVWAVGSNATVLTYNGISWVSKTPNSPPTTGTTAVTDDIYSVALYGQNDGWAVGNRGLILHYNGQNWQTFASSPSTEKLNSISMINDLQAWVVGAFGTILSYNGTTWTKVGSAFSGFDLYNVYMKDDSDGWLVGQDGTMAFYDGTRWISHQKPEGKPSLNASAFYKDTGFIVGQNGTILKFQAGGELAKFDFLFKAETPQMPTKTKPYWSVTYSLLNQSPKTSPSLTYSLPMPKGFELYVPKATPIPAAGSSTPRPSTTPGPIMTSTPTPTLTPMATKTPVRTVTPGASAASAHTTSSVSAPAKMNGSNIEVEIGTVNASEMKTVTILLDSKKNEKKEYPVILKAVLKSADRVISEAIPLTLIAAEPTVIPTNVATPSMANATPSTKPTSQAGDLPQGGSSNAKPVPTPGN